MNLRDVYSRINPKTLTTKGLIIKKNIINPLLQRSQFYFRISSFFNPLIIKDIFEELSDNFKINGKVKLIIGIHESEKLIPVLRQLNEFNRTLNKEELFRRAVNEVISSNLDECLKSSETPNSIFDIISKLIISEFLEIKISAIKSEFKYFENNGIWPETNSIFHPKFSIFKDDSGVVIVTGSINETINGYSNNIENCTCLGNWEYNDLVREHLNIFEDIWNNNHEEITTLEFNYEFYEILKQFKTRYNHKFKTSKKSIQSLLEISKQNINYFHHFFEKVNLLSHQQLIYKICLSRWPIKAIIADEVGLGKTIESGAILSYLLRFDFVKNVAIIVPKNLLIQWQKELFNLFNLKFYIYDSSDKKLKFYTKSGLESIQTSGKDLFNYGTNNILLSWHLARNKSKINGNYILTEKDKIDLLIVDEAHSARFKISQNSELNENETPTLLFSFLVKALEFIPHRLLLTATPQQTSKFDYLALLQLVSGNYKMDIQSLNMIANINNKKKLNSNQKLTCVNQMIELNKYISSIKISDSYSDDLAKLIKLYDEELYIKNHPTTIFTLRNTRQLLQNQGYKFPNVELYSEPVNTDEYDRRLINLINSYISDYLFLFEKNTLERGIGFVKKLYQQRLVSSFKACEDTLGKRLSYLKILISGQNIFNLINSDDENFDDLDVEESEIEIQQYIEVINGRNITTDQIENGKFQISQEISIIKELLTNIKKAKDPKSITFLKILENHLESKEQIIVFSRYTSTTDYISNYLKLNFPSINFGVFQGNKINSIINGIVEELTRDEIVEKFKEKKFKLIICSDAASEGLNLQSANVLINIDVPWNPARLLQRFGRIDRFGQKQNKLFFYNLFYPGTVEDIMYSRLHKRNNDFRELLGHTPDITTESHVERLIEDGVYIHEVPPSEKTIFRNSLINFEQFPERNLAQIIKKELFLNKNYHLDDEYIYINGSKSPYNLIETEPNYLNFNHPIFENLIYDYNYEKVELFSIGSETIILAFCFFYNNSYYELNDLECFVKFLINQEIQLDKKIDNLEIYITKLKELNYNTLIKHNYIYFEEKLTLSNDILSNSIGFFNAKIY
jgi:superfamily II DNA or RNA helicase